MKSSRIFLYLFLPLLVVSIIVCLAFGRTLGSYFLEDDFGEVLYVSQIFAGGWHKVISNFTGNYMEIPNMKVYRPCLLLSIIADYALWHTNASGYFITNILFLIGSALMLYLVLIELTSAWYRPRAILFALFSAALFAANPLHCESVSLMVGRVDIICAFFYLLALWSFIRKGDNRNWLLTATGIISFWIALLTKEMAIGLPVVLTTICLLFSDTLSKQLNTSGLFAAEKYRKSIGHRIRLALATSYPLWISCVLYFIIRYFALGTFLGGYVGSVGANQFSHIIEKWTDIDTISRIVLPLSKAVFHEQSIYHLLLFATYLLLLALIVTKLIVGSISRRWLLLLTVWIATVLAPIYQLWGLGFNLEGARFLFFLTMPLSVILPLLLLSPKNIDNISDSSDISKNRFNSDIGTTEIKLLIPVMVLLSFLVVLDTKIAAKNNIPWIHAGKQTRALLDQGQYLAENLPEEKKAIILGIPKEIDGAHVIYNGLTFNFIMSPPFSKKYYADRFVTFDPILFGNPDSINTSHLRAAKATTLCSCFVWQKDKMKFENLDLPFENHPDNETAFNIPLPTNNESLFPFTKQRGQWTSNVDCLTISHCHSGTAILFSPCEIDPFVYDFMEIEASTSPCLTAKQITVSWPDQSESSDDPSVWETKAVGISSSNLTFLQTEKSEPEAQTVTPITPVPTATDSEFKTYRIPLSRYWRWFTNGKVKGLYIDFSPAQTITIKNIRLISDNKIMPKISVLDLQSDNRGVYPIDNKGINLEIDASRITDISAVKLEFSKPNYFFENFDSNSDQAVLFSTNLSKLNQKFFVESKSFPGPGYYQIRAIGLRSDGQPFGEWSDSLTIKL